MTKGNFNIRKWIWRVVCILLIAAIIYAAFCFRLVITDGTSMEPTFFAGEVLLCTRTFSAPEKGEIVLIDKGDKLVIKRVAYVAGDEIPDSIQYYFEETNNDRIYDFDVMYWGSNTVPDGFIFVTGDNPDHSYDSRYESFGLVALDDVWGKIVEKA